jgi:hypothetical protein
MSRKRLGGNEDGSKAIDSILFKLVSRLVLSLVVIVTFLTLIQCTIKKPESPSWNTNFVIPAINKTYDMEEIIRRIDQDGLATDSLGNLTFTISEQLDTVTVSSDYLRTPDISIAFGQKLDTITISSPIIPPVFLNLQTITGDTGTVPGDTITIGPQSFSLSNVLPPAATYTDASVFAGTANVNLFNNLGLPLDTIILELWDIPYNALISADSFFYSVPSGSTVTIPIDLAGQTLSNQFRIEVFGYTPGGFVNQVSTRSIGTELDFVGSVTVTSATAQIPAISRTFSDQVNLLESDRIDTATIASGNLQLTITNATNLNVNVSVTVPDIYQSGQPLTLVPVISARQVSNLNVNLAGLKVIPSDITVPQTLAINVSAGISATAPNYVTVIQSDSFYVSAILNGVTFSDVAGQFDSVLASFNGITQSIDIPIGFDSVQLTSAVLTLDIINSLDLPGDLDIQVVGNNGKILNLSGSILPSGGLASATSTIVQPSAGDFLSPVPTQFNVNGSVILANGGYQGKIEDNDFIYANITIVSPLEMIISPSQVQTDIERTEIDQTDIHSITDHVIEARFIYNVTSHLPVGLQIDIFFGPDSTTLFTSPQLLVNALQLPAAPFGAGGLVVDTISSGEQEVFLDSNDIKILENDTLFFASTLNLEGTGGQIVKLTANDYLNIRGRFEIEYHFSGEF